ncbi:serine/threonine protein kinase [Roseimicrobium gellanilyticum]|uniref:Serine/threonine protein kinase n=2 Tax=Roseimicrobium gellanilyticum TaxID=748857 RepID=A0A366HU83_9BACT|nr:serine/threonine protein kinase [Roseimicrobium gellanilyticum]
MSEAMKPTQAGGVTIPMPALSPADLAPHFPQLDILECLGRGGMGVVYKARQKTLNRLVALKLLAPERADDPSFASRFTREAQALAALNHPHIVSVHDFGQAGGFYYLMMEYVDGVNLRQLLRSRKLTPEEALRIVPPICDALQCAHNRGIVHRDIKPENLLIDKSGNVKIADFGIAKMVGTPLSPSESEPHATSEATSEATMAVGTPDYAAPEQHEGSATTDHRADIYSLGVVFYEMLTGERPGKELIPPSKRVLVDVRVDEIVLRALEKTPELRFQTADEFRTRVQTVAQGTASGVTAHSPSPRVLRVSSGTFATPDRMVSASDQFWHFSRCRGHLVLDDRQITFTRHGHSTVIPLASIQDLSLGQYPRVMNPAGIKLISVSYGDGGSVKQVFLMPQEGFFGLPSQFNHATEDWWAEARRAVERITGRPPQQTPAENLGVPPSSPWVLIAILSPVLLSFLLAAWFVRRVDGLETFVDSLLRSSTLLPPIVAAGFLFVLMLGRIRGKRGRPLSTDGPASAHSSATTIVTPRTGTATTGETSRESTASPLAGAAAFFAAFSGILGAWAWLSDGESAVLFNSILATALLGIFLAIPVARQPFGKAALIVGSINTALWIFFSVVRVPVPAATVTLAPPQSVSTASHQYNLVKQAELTQAQSELLQKDAAYKAGILSATEYDATKDKVDLLAAELTGDPVQVAEVTLAAAQRRLERLKTLYESKSVSAQEKIKVEGEVAIAMARLMEAKASAAGVKENPTPQRQPSRQVREAQLQAAQAEAALLKAMFEAGRVDALENQAAQLKVEVLQAELTGDPVKVAEIHLRAAREHLQMISQLVAQGQRDTLEQTRAEGEVAIAEARLKEAIARLKEATPKAGDSR